MDLRVEEPNHLTDGHHRRDLPFQSQSAPANEDVGGLRETATAAPALANRSDYRSSGEGKFNMLY